jgi:enoyl-CoA hydratase
VAESFKQIQLWNAAFLQSKDLTEAITAHFEKRKPKYTSKL